MAQLPAIPDMLLGFVSTLRVFGSKSSLCGEQMMLLPVSTIPVCTFAVGRIDSILFFEFRNGQHVNTPINPQTKLPYIFLFKDLLNSIDNINRSLYTCVAKENNQNLSDTQKSTLKLHWRFGHKSLEYIKWISRRGILGSHGNRISKITTNDCPKCATCIYSKQTTNPSIIKAHKQSQEQHQLNINKLQPGDMIATDQFEISKAGRLFGTAGKESLNKKYCGGTIFYDPASKIIRVYFQTSLNASETIVSKNKFERFMGEHGINVKHYRTDNGIFTKTKFMQEIETNRQHISSCGVGAHHQNAHAERAIRTVLTTARALMLHAILRWPDKTKTDYWPMATQHASYLNNVLPRMDCGFSPMEILSGTISDHKTIQNLPVWGCPTYVCIRYFKRRENCLAGNHDQEGHNTWDGRQLMHQMLHSYVASPQVISPHNFMLYLIIGLKQSTLKKTTTLIQTGI